MVDLEVINVCGGNTLCGEVTIQGSKNGALPVLAATVLIKGKTIIENCPRISDIEHMIKLLEFVGCRIEWVGRSICVDASTIHRTKFPADHAKVMRSSVMLLGAMLGRTKEVEIEFPGGCVIGERPIDMHVLALKKLGVEFDDLEHKVCAKVTKLAGAEILLPFPSVGATENSILAAVLAEGVTVIRGCAIEPEIVELCSFLKRAGADIVGDGKEVITITGVTKLEETAYRIMPDRIVAGTYILASIITGGTIAIHQAPVDQMQEIFKLLQRMGADVATSNDWAYVNGENAKLAIPKIKTNVYPGFPTDLQSAFMSVLALANGCSVIEETIFENRYKTVPYLKKMGADIQVVNGQAVICGVRSLKGCFVEAMDLRGGAALIIAGLAASGETNVSNSHFIDRGYEDICRDLRLLGANIKKKEY